MRDVIYGLTLCCDIVKLYSVISSMTSFTNIMLYQLLTPCVNQGFRKPIFLVEYLRRVRLSRNHSFLHPRACINIECWAACLPSFNSRRDKRDKDPKLSHNLWQDPFQVKVFGSATNCTNSCRFFIKLSFETVFFDHC